MKGLIGICFVVIIGLATCFSSLSFGESFEMCKKRNKPPYYPSASACWYVAGADQRAMWRPVVGLRVTVERSQGCELVEGIVDAIEIKVPLEEPADLRLREAVLGGLDGFTDAVGDGVSAGEPEEMGWRFGSSISRRRGPPRGGVGR
jgi:hypothetical protein